MIRISVHQRPMLIRRFLLCFIVPTSSVGLLWAGAAVAQGSAYSNLTLPFGDSTSECIRGDPNGGIAACTVLIQSGNVAREEVPVVYYDRAIHFLDKGDYNHAIEDFTTAIQLRPQFASAHLNRGVAYNL